MEQSNPNSSTSKVLTFVKWFFAVLFFLSVLGSLKDKAFLSAIIFLLIGLLLLPPLTEFWRAKIPFLSNKSYKGGLILLLLIIAVSFNANISNNGVNDKEVKDISSEISSGGEDIKQYENYFAWSKEAVESLSEKEKAQRQEILDKQRSTRTYDSLITNKTVSAKYILIIHTIANGIKNLRIGEGFSVDKELIQELNKSPNGDDKVAFVLSSIALAQSQRGGLTKEMVELFERYKSKYNLFGQPATIYSTNGQEQDRITLSYDFTPIFSMLEPKSKDFIEAIYKAKVKGISNWENSNSDDLQYPFMSNIREYSKRLLLVNPWSEILPQGINDDFWEQYDPIVKQRALGLILSNDCKGLQDEFNVTSDNLDRFHNAGKTSPRNLKYMEFLDTQLRKLGCYE